MHFQFSYQRQGLFIFPIVLLKHFSITFLNGNAENEINLEITEKKYLDLGGKWKKKGALISNDSTFRRKQVQRIQICTGLLPEHSQEHIDVIFLQKY